MKKPRYRRQASNGSEQISFLPEPDFNPIYPSPNTLEAKLLKRLLKGESFTHPEWEQEYGSWRAAATKFELIKKGWPIETQDIYAPTPEAPHRYISRYYLPQEIIKKVVGGNL